MFFVDIFGLESKNIICVCVFGLFWHFFLFVKKYFRPNNNVVIHLFPKYHCVNLFYKAMHTVRISCVIGFQIYVCIFSIGFQMTEIVAITSDRKIHCSILSHNKNGRPTACLIAATKYISRLHDPLGLNVWNCDFVFK